jgi:hypothetical protein
MPFEVRIFMVETQNRRKVGALAGREIRVTFYARRLPKGRVRGAMRERRGRTPLAATGLLSQDPDTQQLPTS